MKIKGEKMRISTNRRTEISAGEILDIFTLEGILNSFEMDVDSSSADEKSTSIEGSSDLTLVAPFSPKKVLIEIASTLA
jgi:hypothetical protein